MRSYIWHGLLAGALLLSSVGPTLASKRIALVVGNDAYESLPKLQKAVNDARAVGVALQELGFEVIVGENLTRREMNQRLADLERVIAHGDQVFFFYAGHGVALGAENYLLPVDMPAPQAGEVGLVRNEGHSADAIIRAIQSRGSAVSFIVLDACRNNPFADAGTRDIGLSRGLARIDAPSGVFVLFSAGIGQKALDRLDDSDPDPNSVFTRKLVPLLRTAGLSHVDLAKRVQKEVSALAETIKYKQEPAYYDQIVGEIVLRAGAPATTEPAAPRDAGAEWLMVRETTSVAAIEAFIAKHGGDPIYRALAEERLALLRTPDPPAEKPADACADGLLVAVAGRNDCLKPGDVFRDCQDCPEMVVVPAGRFTMGSPESETLHSHDQDPQHEVTIARPFAVGRLEVTYEEWESCVSQGGCSYNPIDDGFGRGSRPVMIVSWHDAQTYVAWLSTTTGKTYRLLTESEWEYSARAGTTTPFSTGTTLTGADAQTFSYSPVKVGSYRPNAFGLYDMHGNVGEWVEDCYSSDWDDGYKGAPTDGSASTIGDCSVRVYRGYQDCPSACRFTAAPTNRFGGMGFRVARTLAP